MLYQRYSLASSLSQPLSIVTPTKIKCTWCLSLGPPESRGALVCWGSCHKASQTELLKPQKLIISQMWGLEVQDQSVSRVGSSWGRLHSRPLPWAHKCLSSCSHDILSVCVCLCQNSLFYKDVSQIGLGPILMTLPFFKKIILFNCLFLFFGYAGSLLLCGLFSTCGEWGATL